MAICRAPVRVLLASPPVPRLQRVHTSLITLATFRQIPRGSAPRSRLSVTYSRSVATRSSLDATAAPLGTSPLQDVRSADSNDRSESAELSHQWRRFASQLVAHRFLAARGEVADSQPATARQKLENDVSQTPQLEAPQTDDFVEAVVSGQSSNEDAPPELISEFQLDTILADKGETKRAVLALARSSPHLFSSFSLGDVRAIVSAGCPSTDRKAVNAAKRLRSLLSLSEAKVCPRCPLKNTCARAGKEIAPQESYSFVLPAAAPTTDSTRDVTDTASATSDVLRLAVGYALLTEAEAAAAAAAASAAGSAAGSYRRKPVSAAAAAASSSSARILLVAGEEVPHAAIRRQAQPATASAAVVSTGSGGDWRPSREGRESREGRASRRGRRGNRKEIGENGENRVMENERGSRGGYWKTRPVHGDEGTGMAWGRGRNGGSSKSSSGGSSSSSSSSSGTSVERWSPREGLQREGRNDEKTGRNERGSRVWERRLWERR
ncbi:unnamed protein product [Closterium sp. NIES-54]